MAYLFCPVSNQAGRYKFHKVLDGIVIMDTVNADFYLLSKGEWGRANPVTGKTDVIDIVPLPKKTNK